MLSERRTTSNVHENSNDVNEADFNELICK